MTARAASPQLFLPCLRGEMGAWTYYVCTMPLREIARRVDFAKDIHKNKGLRDMIQRELKKKRGKAIAQYLQSQKERLFNALVVGVYGGDPALLEIGRLRPNTRLTVSPPSDLVQ